jgi:hypothetical protein
LAHQPTSHQKQVKAISTDILNVQRLSFMPEVCGEPELALQNEQQVPFLTSTFFIELFSFYPSALISTENPVM